MSETANIQDTEQILAAFVNKKSCSIVLDTSPYHLAKILSVGMKKSPELKAAIFYAIKDFLKDPELNEILQPHINEALKQIPE